MPFMMELRNIFKESHKFLHGEKSSLWYFLPLVLENKWNVIDELIPYYEESSLL